MNEIILLGGGGHCRSVIDVIEDSGLFRVAGIVDTQDKLGSQISGYSVIATDDDLERLTKEYQYFHVTVGQIRSNAIRVRLFDFVRSHGGSLPALLSRGAYVSKRAEVSEGTVVMNRAFVNSGARIGLNCIINTGAVVEHDSIVGDHCHVSTGAYITGGSVIGSDCFIGSQATIIQGISIAHHNLIAAGAVVTQNTNPYGMYAGNPAYFKRTHY